MTAAVRQHRHRTLLPYAAAGLAAALLGACTSGDPGTTVTTAPPAASTTTSTSAAPSTTSTAPSPTTSVDPVLARIPDAARARTAAGAQAFARFFIESLNAGASKPDSRVLAGLFAPSCETCQAMYKSLKILETKKQRHTGDSIRVSATSSLTFSTSAAQVLIDVEQKSVDVVDSKGATVRRTADGPGTFVMSISLNGGHWIATKLQTAS
ncbi:DUF6318 family protein [Terrabacter aerolatus]|nr:DUF6318 family protein [Terrabacter aerolatus]